MEGKTRKGEQEDGRFRDVRKGREEKRWGAKFTGGNHHGGCRGGAGDYRLEMEATGATELTEIAKRRNGDDEEAKERGNGLQRERERDFTENEGKRREGETRGSVARREANDPGRGDSRR